jgi:hypothetical protein
VLITYSIDGLFPDIELMSQKLATGLCAACNNPATLSTEDSDTTEFESLARAQRVLLVQTAAYTLVNFVSQHPERCSLRERSLFTR